MTEIKPKNAMLRNKDAELFECVKKEVSQKLFGNDKLNNVDFILWLIQNRKEV